MSGEELETARMSAVVVVQSEAPAAVRRAQSASGAPEDVWLAVGTAKHVIEGRVEVDVIAKLTLSSVDASGRWLPVALPAARQAPLSVDAASRHASAAPGSLDYRSDFARTSAPAEVRVVGHAKAVAPAAAIAGVLEIAGHRMEIAASAGAPTTRIPLVPPFVLVSSPGERPEPRSPVLLPAAISPGAIVAVSGLFGDGAARTVRLPGLTVVANASIEGDLRELDARLEALHIDADTGQLTLRWRARVSELRSESDIDRILLSLESSDAPRPLEERQSDAQRGRVEFATREEEAVRGETPVADHPRLEAARYGTWAAVAPEPRLALDRYAEISAELAESTKGRARILEREGLDEFRWMTEERAWLERFAAEAMERAPTTSVLFGELFVKAQDALAKPEEGAWTIADYATLQVRMERAGDVMSVLDDVPMTLSQWMRLERRCLALASSDPDAQEELEAATRFAEEYVEEALSDDDVGEDV